ncbi:MAG: type II CAAX endopeptidase family protein [Armatimonadota bacterium]
MMPADFRELDRAELRSFTSVDGPSMPIGMLMWWVLISLAAALLSTWIAAVYVDRRPLHALGLRIGGRWWADFGFGLVLGVALITGLVALQIGLGWMEITARGGSDANAPRLLREIVNASIVFLSVGIYEEVVIRGYQMTNLAEGLNFRRWNAPTALMAALLLSSVVFSLLHAVNPGYSALALVNLALISILALGLSYALTGRLGLSIGLHTSWNFTLAFIFGLPVSGVRLGEHAALPTTVTGPELWTGGGFGPEGGGLGTVAILAACAALLLWTRWREGDVAIREHIAEPPGSEPA